MTRSCGSCCCAGWASDKSKAATHGITLSTMGSVSAVSKAERLVAVIAAMELGGAGRSEVLGSSEGLTPASIYEERGRWA